MRSYPDILAYMGRRAKSTSNKSIITIFSMGYAVNLGSEQDNYCARTYQAGMATGKKIDIA
jgi:hypothetical protein